MTSPRLLTAAAAVVAVVVSVLAGPSVLAPGVLGDCAAAAGQVRVSVVVDTGTGGPTATCVVVGEGATGADVLVARARALGTPAPRWDGSGLLCAIDGVPESGCGERTGDGYRYWSYWDGEGGSWAYSSIGPATNRVGEGAVEGWHFVEGAGNPSDPPPRTRPDHDATCGPAPVPTTATTAPPAAPPTTTAPGPSAPPADAGTSATPGAGGSSGTSGGPATTAAPAGSAGGGAADAPSTTGSSEAGSTTAAGRTDDTTPDETDATDADTAPGTATGTEQAATLPTAVQRSSSGVPASTVLGLVLVAALGAGAALRSRRLRRAT